MNNINKLIKKWVTMTFKYDFQEDPKLDKEGNSHKKDSYDAEYKAKIADATIHFIKGIQFASYEIINNRKNMIYIPKQEYEDLQNDSNMLLALKDTGVDNWSGYSDALEILKEIENDNN